MRSKGISFLLAALFGLAAAAPVSAEDTGSSAGSLSKGYKTKYRQILMKAEEDESISGVYIGDLVGDEREELYIAHNDFGYSTLYIPAGKNKLLRYDFDVVSIWGFTKYIKAEKQMICMNNYGHTSGAPYSLSMELLSVEGDSISRYTLYRDWNNDGSAPVSFIKGKEVTDEEFATALNSMIAETSRSEYIPLVKYSEDSLSYYEGELDSTDYETYINEKLS